MNNSLPLIYTVRHGETEWTISGQHTGRTDIPLTPQGERHVRLLDRRLKGIPFKRVFTSPLLRSRRTCELAGFGGRAEIDPDLVEVDYGRYEGCRTAQIHEEDPDWVIFRDGCPGGESVKDLTVRADRVVDRLRDFTDGKVLLFTHGHFLRCLAMRWISLPILEGRRFALDTGSVSIFGYVHSLSEPAIRLWNDFDDVEL